jgi:hypothetical protein
MAMTKYLAMEVFCNSGMGEGVRFCLLKMDEVQEVRMAQRFRIVRAASLLASGYGLSIESIDFADREPLFVTYGEMTLAQDALCKKIHDAMEEAGIGGCTENVIVDGLDEAAVDGLPSMWPDHSSLLIGSDGSYMAWIFYNNSDEYEVPIYRPELFFDMIEFTAEVGRAIQ